MSTLAVDFDGVIHGYSRGWLDGSIYDEPVDGALESLRLLMEEYSVFIFTARGRAQVAHWLEDHNIPTYIEQEREGRGRKFWDERGRALVTSRKLPAVAYIDDRGIRFESWPQTLETLRRFYGFISDERS